MAPRLFRFSQEAAYLTEAAVTHAPFPYPSVTGSVQIFLNGQVSLCLGRGTGSCLLLFLVKAGSAHPVMRSHLYNAKHHGSRSDCPPGKPWKLEVFFRVCSPRRGLLLSPALFRGEFWRLAQATGTHGTVTALVLAHWPVPALGGGGAQGDT